MAQQRHDIGWKKAHREGAPTAGRAAARRRAAKAARAAVLFARAEAAELAGQWAEESAIRARARAAEVAQAAPVPAPQPAPQDATCAHCGRAMSLCKTGRSRAYCSVACRKAAARNTPPLALSTPLGR